MFQPPLFPGEGLPVFKIFARFLLPQYRQCWASRSLEVLPEPVSDETTDSLHESEPPQMDATFVAEVAPLNLAREIKLLRAKAQRAALLSLPAEIVVMIMHHLDSIDILNLRKCAAELEGPSRERSVWRGIIRREGTTRIARPFSLPKPLAQCSSDDIEKPLIGWSRVPTFAPDQPLRSFTTKLAPSDIAWAHGLGETPDGRYHLKMAMDGAIYSFDCHQPGEPPALLCSKPSSDAAVADRFAEIAFDCISVLADGDGEELLPTTFNAAVMHYTKSDINARQWESFIEIWRLTLEEGGYSAHRLASFIEDPVLFNRSISIYGDHVAYFRHEEQSTVIVNWTSVPSGTTFFPRIHVQPIGVQVILLPGRRVAITKRGWLSIGRWDNGYHSPGNELGLGGWGDEAEVWRQKMQCYGPTHASVPYLVGDTVRFVFASTDVIAGIIVPLSGDLYQIVTLFKATRSARIPSLEYFHKLGYHKGVVLGPGVKAVLLNYFWPDDIPFCEPGSVSIPVQGIRYLSSLSFDETRNEMHLWNYRTELHTLYQM